MVLIPFACIKLNRAALSCKARILPVRVSGRLSCCWALPQVNHAGLLALRLLRLGLRPVVETGNAGLDFFQQLVVGGDLPVDFPLVGADAALLHLAGRWAPGGQRGFYQCPGACSCGGLPERDARRPPMPGWYRPPMPPAKSPHSLCRSSLWCPPGGSSSRLSRPGCAGRSRPGRMPFGTSRPMRHFLLRAGRSA